MMKLRTDLLKHLTAEDILQEAKANQHRYRAEPSFSKTGTGHLSPRSTEDSANEAASGEALTRKLTHRLRQNGKTGGSPSRAYRDRWFFKSCSKDIVPPDS